MKRKQKKELTSLGSINPLFLKCLASLIVILIVLIFTPIIICKEILKKKEKEIDNTIDSIKKHIKEITDKPVESVERFAVVNRSEYIKKVNSGYSTRDYSFDTADEHWIDQMSGTDIEVEELPFDPAIIQWDELEQCYIADETLQSVYMVERI